jgi:hypothetical protein
MKGAKFAEGTQFVEKVSAAKKTPGKDAKTNDCIVRIKIKLTGGHKDIPESIMGMINHSLSILHKWEKKACYLNRKKSLEASKATNFPKDFTNFYDGMEYGMNELRLLQTTFPPTSHGHSWCCLTLGANGTLLRFWKRHP